MGGGVAQQGMQGVRGEHGAVAGGGLRRARRSFRSAGRIREAVQADGAGGTGAPRGAGSRP